MAAPDTQSLYQFENALENAAKAILTAIPLNAYRQRDTATLATPWAAVQLSGTRADGGMHQIGNVGWPNSFEASLRIIIATNRTKNASDHSAYVGKVRAAMYTLTNWSGALLPYHYVWSAMETGSVPSIDAEENWDMTEITFALKFQINELAWP